MRFLHPTGSYGSGYFGLFFITADPSKESLRITIPYKVPTTPIGSAITGGDGRFEFVWKNPPTTAYSVEAVYAGDERFWPSTDMAWSAGSVQAVTIDIQETELAVPANTSVNLTFAWAAKTADQVKEFVDNATFDVVLDGKPLPGGMDYWGDIGKSGNENYLSRWQYPIGVLNPGSHRAEIKLALTEPVTDGFVNEYSHVILKNTLKIHVEE